MLLNDERTDGVPHRSQENAARPDEPHRSPIRIEPEQRDDADEPDAEPDEPTRPDFLMHAHQRPDDHHHQRHSCEQDAGERGAHPTLAQRDEIERPHELNEREGDEQAPVFPHSAQGTTPGRYRHEQERGAHQATPRHPRRRQLDQRLLDEEIRRAPDDAQGEKGHPYAYGHRTSLATTSRTTPVIERGIASIRGSATARS